MLRGPLLHPEILAALGASGHFSQLVIADGNFPAGDNTGPSARRVHLNLAPGVVSCTQVLEALLPLVPIQEANLMQPPPDFDPPIHATYRTLLGANVPIVKLERQAFYEKVRSPRTTLLVCTGDQRRFANLLLVVGVVKLPEESF